MGFHRGCGGRLGLPLPPPLPHACRDDAGGQCPYEGRGRMIRATALLTASTAPIALAMPAAAQDPSMNDIPSSSTPPPTPNNHPPKHTNPAPTPHTPHPRPPPQP